MDHAYRDAIFKEALERADLFNQVAQTLTGKTNDPVTVEEIRIAGELVHTIVHEKASSAAAVQSATQIYPQAPPFSTCPS